MKFFLLLFTLLMPVTALAESFSLYKRNGWVVEYVVRDSGLTWCALQKQNAEGHVYDITYHQSGNMRFYIIFDFPDDNERTNVEFYLHFDAEVWKIPNGKLWGNMIYVDMDLTENQFSKFFTDMAHSNFVYMISKDRTRVITSWPLVGSTKALDALADCMQKL